jgi:glycosidase
MVRKWVWVVGTVHVVGHAEKRNPSGDDLLDERISNMSEQCQKTAEEIHKIVDKLIEELGITGWRVDAIHDEIMGWMLDAGLYKWEDKLA